MRLTYSLKVAPKVGRCAFEEWRPCPGYEGLYEVSSLGRVRSLHKRFATPRLCKLGTDQTGYPTVMLSKDGTRKPYTVHRLVALAFHGDKRSALHREVAHMDGNRKNGRADNLKWVSKAENESHKRIHGTSQRGASNGFARLTEDAVREIRSCPPYKVDIKGLARRYGVSRHAIDKVRSGQNWRHVTPAPPAAIAVRA